MYSVCVVCVCQYMCISIILCVVHDYLIEVLLGITLASLENDYKFTNFIC